MLVPATETLPVELQAGLSGAAISHASRFRESVPRALVLLAGAVRASTLSKAVGRSMLDLPVGNGRTLLSLWQQQGALLGTGLGLSGGVPINVHLNRLSAAPHEPTDPALPRPVLELDRAEYRGTGGVLRDAADEFDPEDRILVANAYQLILHPLDELLEELSASTADIAILVDSEGAPCGVQLVRCESLRHIPARGFVDFKEQALPVLARRFDVRVVRRPVVSVSVRRRESYIRALRLLHDPRGRGLVEPDPFSEDCFSTFAVVEEGAEVARGARVHDSVVLRGGRVGDGAVVARSVVCGGASVERGEVVVDRVVCGARAFTRDAA